MYNPNNEAALGTTVENPDSSATSGLRVGYSAWFMLFMLVVVYAVNIADRYVLSTLIEPLKKDLNLSDTSVGFLTGVTLAVFYVTAGIPMGVLADKTNRKRLTAACIGIWSGMTVLCGLSQTYWQFALSRIGVGIGEAGSTPSSHSMIADRFPAHMRATAFTIWGIGACIGAWIGGSGAAYLVNEHGWRGTLVIFGLAGLPIAALLWLFVREPARGLHDVKRTEEQSTIKSTIQFTLGQKSLLHVLIGNTVLTYWGWGLIWWTPSFLVRSHNMTVSEAGAMLGTIHGVGGLVAMLITALVMSNSKLGAEFQAKFVGWITLFATIATILIFSLESTSAVTLLLWIFIPAIYMYLGPTAALLQNLVKSSMRGKIVALMLFAANITNLVVAPLLIGFLSDTVSSYIPDHQNSLKYVLFGMAFTGFWAGYHYIKCTKYLRQDMIAAGAVSK
ncbi:MFS transporter [Pseudomonas jessenii]|uniref:MFS transporter n=1 Tax=Pseudomonas jessenii TaxID=77298 RepID=A0A2W0F577_PSEJE|nr:MFS transporter [Pseudomonas jessenii]PYY69824.1 MFS transporter [Pseudomonas jessenii]